MRARATGHRSGGARLREGSRRILGLVEPLQPLRHGRRHSDRRDCCQIRLDRRRRPSRRSDEGGIAASLAIRGDGRKQHSRDMLAILADRTGTGPRDDDPPGPLRQCDCLIIDVPPGAFDASSHTVRWLDRKLPHTARSPIVGAGPKRARGHGCPDIALRQTNPTHCAHSIGHQPIVLPPRHQANRRQMQTRLGSGPRRTGAIAKDHLKGRHHQFSPTCAAAVPGSDAVFVRGGETPSIRRSRLLSSAAIGAGRRCKAKGRH